MCGFDWICLHCKAIFRRLSGFERPEDLLWSVFRKNAAVDPWSQVKENRRRYTGKFAKMHLGEFTVRGVRIATYGM